MTRPFFAFFSSPELSSTKEECLLVTRALEFIKNLLEQNSKKASSFPRQCPWLEVQCFIVDVLLLHVEKFGSKNCYSAPEIACTSRFADLVESR